MAHTSAQLYAAFFKGLTDPTPDTPTTADDLVSRINSAIGQWVYTDDCHALALAAAQAAGASLPGGWGGQSLDNTGPKAVADKFANNALWYQAYRGDLYDLNWTDRAVLAQYLRAGDVIRADNGYSYHTMTVVSVSSSDIKIVDNVGAKDGKGNVAVTQHSLFDYPKLSDDTASVIRLKSTGGQLIQPPGGGGAPLLSVSDAQVREGSGALKFTVSLNKTTSQDVTVNAYTYAGTAYATKGDYTQLSKNITIKAGTTSATVEVAVADDAIIESNETLELRLRNATNANIGDNSGTGTILDNDSTTQPVAPKLTVKDVTVDEGARIANVTVSLDRKATSTVTFSAATYGGTASSATGDYTGFTSKLGQILSGAQTATIAVAIADDKYVEGRETFEVGVNDVKSADVVRARGTVTISDNDAPPAPPPKISISDASAAEGETARFTLSLDRAAASDVTVLLTTYKGTANRNGADYNGFIDRKATIKAGQTSATVLVTTIDDKVKESNETFTVEIASATGATISRRRANGTIIDNDPSARIALDDTASVAVAAATETVASVENFGAFLLSDVDTQWQVVAAGDFNDDGYGDLVLRNQTSGGNAIWFMENGTRADGVFLPEAPNLDWQIAASADMNHDGQTDLLWRNNNTGENAIWLMNGASRTETVQLPSTANTDWRIGGVADMNGDESADILWRNQTSGENAAWLMEKTDFLTSAQLPATADVDWRMVGAGDVNEDSSADILWHNRATGTVAYWAFDDLTRVETGTIGQTSNLDWEAYAVASMDGVGGADIVWRNTVTGGNAAWSLGTPVSNG